MKKFIFGALATIGGLIVVSLVIMVLFVTSTRMNIATVDENSVLFIDFKSSLSENRAEAGLAGLFQEPSDSLYDLIRAIDSAARDPKIVGIVARLDNTNMGLAQAQELRNSLMKFRVLGHESGKFTIAYADTFGEAGSGTLSYYLASAFDEIWVQPIGTIGLTGIAIEMPFIKQAAEDLGIKARIGRREEYKTFMDSITENEMTPANRESLESILNSIMNQIVRDVALGREITESEVMEAVNKGPLMDNEALKAGLIDRIAYFDEIETQANSKVKGTINKLSVNRYLEALGEDEHEAGQPKVALIYGVGNIIRRTDQENFLMQDNEMDSGRMTRAFKEAVQDKDVSAIVFRVNSGGGSPVASETILRAVRKAQQAGKPVVVSMSDYAASGGYWISSYADKIVAQPGTLTGSIGVISGKIVIEELWKKLGVNWDNVKVGENALMWSMNQDYTEYGWQRLENYLDQIYSSFLQRVSEGRKLPIEHVEQVAKGRVWTGEDALKYGLVDKLGDMKDAVEVAKELAGLKDQKVHLQVYPMPKGFAETFRNIIYGEDEELYTSSVASSTIGAMIKGLVSLMVLIDELQADTNGSVRAKMPFSKIKG